MAITPSKPTFLDVTSRGKVRVWVITSMATTDTVVVPGIKTIWDVQLTNRPGTTFTYTTTAAANSACLLTLVCTASSTGSAIGTGATILTVYGQ